LHTIGTASRKRSVPESAAKRPISTCPRCELSIGCPSGCPDGDLRAWLFAIQRNLFINAYRQRQRQGPHVALDDVALPGAAAQQEAGLEVRDVLAALDQLPEEQKSLLLLIGVEDFSYEDAARILGVPMGTVMSRLSRARQKLRSILETGRATMLRRVK
jgi:RNA polymerase sigma-70 factor (ECF subfamily)